MKKYNPTIKEEVLIIGSGIAGASAAIELAENGVKVILITRAKDPHNTNTDLAQGGIVARGPNDSKEILFADTFDAGDKMGNRRAIEILAEDGPRFVYDFLIKKIGVKFTRGEDKKLHYTKEAAHTFNRILHFHDQTGHEIQRKLLKKAKALKNINILENHTLIDLLTLPHHARDPLKIYDDIVCVGAYILDNENKRVKKILAKKIILATGGVGQVYSRTVNSEGARGDGLAAAARAGARIINAEYIQFHPTSFYHREINNFLISEAVRGEGGRLINRLGKDFMKKYDKRGSLAPRDIVARGIYDEMITTKEPCVFLDIASHKDAQEIKKHFSKIYETCLAYGVDITKEPIPVAPSAHYFCGGVQAGEWGKTTIKNLYAAGEVACTGVHGANRLASTSLLEGLVWGIRSAWHIITHLHLANAVPPADVKDWKYACRDEEFPDPALILADWQTIKLIMWNYVGIIRTEKKLQRAVADLEYLCHRIEQFYREVRLTDELVGLRNGVFAALIIARAALANKESRGAHYRV
ncbi:MAG: L-aspartate oxidase [bacterium]